MLKNNNPNPYPEHMSEGSNNDSEDEDLFEHPDDEMPAAYIIDVGFFEWAKYKDSCPTQAPADLEQCQTVNWMILLEICLNKLEIGMNMNL